MKKRMLSLALALSLAVSLFAPAMAAGDATQPVTPTAPEWIDEEDYLIFPGDEIYLPENWAEIEDLRERARNGATMVTKWDYSKTNPNRNWLGGAAGRAYEVGLIWLKYAENRGVETTAGKFAIYSAGEAFRWAATCWEKACQGEMDARYDALFLHEVRANLIYDYERGDSEYWGKAVGSILVHENMTLENFYDAPYMNLVSEETRFSVYQDVKAFLTKKGYQLTSAYVQPSPVGDVQLFLDDLLLEADVPAVITNGRTMIPIRAVAEALGADVGWEEAAQQVTLERAGTTIVMTLGSRTALVNGEPVEMDIAPYTENDRTLLPVRYVAEFFGQKVDWEDKTHRVRITEDKSAAEGSNLEAWALPMGAMLNYMNQTGAILTRLPEAGAPARFGAYARSAILVEDYREKLAGWNISGREDLVSTVLQMTLAGHNASFLEMAEDVKQRSEKERKAISEASGAWPYFMWEYTEELAEKWGDRGILAWDLFRMSNLVQWGYVAGYVTYEEALTLLKPAATLLCANFTSWDEAYENYLDGYVWWARISPDSWTEDDDVKKAETREGWQDWMKLPRGVYYFNMKTDPSLSAIFDDTLFETGVIGLPEE